MSQPGGLIYKTRVPDDGAEPKVVAHKTRTADDDAHASPRRAAAKPGSEMAWWEWVDDRIDYRLAAATEATGQVLGQFRAQAREHCDRAVDTAKHELTVLLREQITECARALRQETREETKAAREQLERDDASTRRELELSKRELAVLQKEIGFERELRDLHSEVEEARKQVPKVPAIASRLEAEQTALRKELAAVKDQHTRLRSDWSQTDYAVGELRKEATAAKAASIEVEFASSSTHFQMKAAHPDAARALKEFAAEIINGEADGTIWLPGSAGAQ
jgi:chromosome segregation ATPase